MITLSLKRPYHSASVSMSLLVGELAYPVAQTGPGFAIMAEPLEVPIETPATLIVQIDDHTQRHPIHLCPTSEEDPALVRFSPAV